VTDGRPDEARSTLTIRPMSDALAFVAPSQRLAHGVAAETAHHSPDRAGLPFSLSAYLAEGNPPARVVLCPSGRSAREDRRFLAAAAGRLLWPAPPRAFRLAIGGLLNLEDPPPGAQRGPRREGVPRAALLLEGSVDRARALAALRAAGPRLWIVETPGRVRLSAADLRRVARAGVVWAALAPVRLAAVALTPAFAASVGWRSLVPPRTPVWVRGAGGVRPRGRR
jgi:hypothetical protein